jgi:hypothetical protein
MRTGHRHIVGGPGIGGDFIFSPAGVASGFGLHFQDDEIAKAFFVEPPCRSESCDACADDDDPDFLSSRGLRKRRVIAEAVAEREAVVDELAVNAFFGFGGESDKGGGGYCAEESPAGRHCFSVALEGNKKGRHRRAAALRDLSLTPSQSASGATLLGCVRSFAILTAGEEAQAFAAL